MNSSSGTGGALSPAPQLGQVPSKVMRLAPSPAALLSARPACRGACGRAVLCWARTELQLAAPERCPAPCSAARTARPSALPGRALPGCARSTLGSKSSIERLWDGVCWRRAEAQSPCGWLLTQTAACRFVLQNEIPAALRIPVG